jgi:hypothetical protein
VERVEVRVKYVEEDGATEYTNEVMYLPKRNSSGDRRVSTSSSSRGSGVGIDREIASTIQNSSEEVITAALRLVGLWQTKGLATTVTLPEEIATTINIPPGFTIHHQTLPEQPREKIHIERTPTTNRKTNVRVKLEDINDKKLKYQTGFPSLLALLGYVAIICDGDIDAMVKSTSELTWFEEWYLFFETVYGRTCLRWIDAEFKYDICSSTLREVFDKKLDMVLRVRRSWPTFASLNEDELYRKSFKWDAYLGRRVIMYDNTNIKIKQPSDPETQRTTYSLYYSGNVGKGAVFIQPCGWMGSHEIWTGGVSDTHYMQQAKVFDSLNHFLVTSPLEDETTRSIEFTIILDRGYRCTADALAAGGHYTLQPIFSPVDRQFNTIETFISSSVAADRSGNERAVHYLKISDYISRGLLSAESTKRLCDTWLVWGFQVSFMYRPVL